MRRPRMTIRGWMVAVAIAAVVCLGVERFIALRRLREHEAMLARYRAAEAFKRAKMNMMLRLIRVEEWGGNPGGEPLRQPVSQEELDEVNAELEKARRLVRKAEASIAGETDRQP